MRLSAAALQTRGLSSLEMGFSGSHELSAADTVPSSPWTRSGTPVLLPILSSSAPSIDR